LTCPLRPRGNEDEETFLRTHTRHTHAHTHTQTDAYAVNASQTERTKNI